MIPLGSRFTLIELGLRTLDPVLELIVYKGKGIIHDGGVDVIPKDILHKMWEDVPLVEEVQIPESFQMIHQLETSEDHMDQAFIDQRVLFFYSCDYALIKG